MSTILQQLVSELDAGRLRVIDLTQPLGPDTPVIGLPPIFAASPGVTLDVISRTIDSWLFFSERWIMHSVLRSAPIIRCTACTASSFDRCPKRDMILRFRLHGYVPMRSMSRS